MAPPALIVPYCENQVGLQSVYCNPNGTSRHGHKVFLPEVQDQLFGKMENNTPHFAAFLDPKIKIGGEASSNVAIDHSDHSVVGMKFEFEQSLATIAIVFAILGIIISYTLYAVDQREYVTLQKHTSDWRQSTDWEQHSGDHQHPTFHRGTTEWTKNTNALMSRDHHRRHRQQMEEHQVQGGLNSGT